MADPQRSIGAEARGARWLDRPGTAAWLYLGLTLLMTFPLILNFRSSVPKCAVDLWTNYWNFWWWKVSLLELHQSPFHTPYLFHPAGVSIVWHTNSPFNMLVSLPVNFALGPAAAYNFCVVLALWLSGFGAYLLVKDVTGEPRGAFLAGLVFAFFPQRFEETLEHLNLFSVQFMPLAALFLLRLGRAGGWRNVVGLGGCYALNSLVDWQLGILLTLLLIPLGIAVLLRRERESIRILGDLGLAAALAALLVLPMVWPLLAGLASGETWFQKPQVTKGIDPLFLFLPSERHPLWGSLTFDFYARHRAYPTEGFLCYLGFAPLALSILSLVRKSKHAPLWCGIFLASLVMALGPQLIFYGEILDGRVLPFAWLAQLPVLSLLRVANRFLIISSLALAVMVGLGWTVLRVRSDRRLLLLASLILIEYLWLPYPMQKVELSPFYQQIAASDRRRAILDIPFTPDFKTVLNMVAQTVHGRPIAGGYLTVTPPEALRPLHEDPVLSQLTGLTPAFSGRLDREHLLALGFDTAILHKDRRHQQWVAKMAAVGTRDLLQRKIVTHQRPFSDETFDAIRAAFEAACGKPAFEDDSIIVFHLERGEP